MSTKGSQLLLEWLDEIKSGPDNARIGIFFTHNGTVRGTSRDGLPVSSLEVSCNHERLCELVAEAEAMPGVIAARAWVNEGTLAVGDDLTLGLVAGDVRKNVFKVWETLSRRVKHEAMTQREILESDA